MVPVGYRSIGVAYSAEVASATKAGLECWSAGLERLTLQIF
jgi:hypothetical protein